MAPLKVIIIGGGLAGSCLANGLVNKSPGQIDVTVFERDNENDERCGYQIRLGAHALIGFKACLTEKQYADLLPCFGRSGGILSSAPCIFSPSDLKVLIDLSKAPIYEKSAPIARTRLRDILQAPLRERKIIRYSKKYIKYEVLAGNRPEENSIRVHFADGSQEDCDILLSAEGSGSRTNKQLGLNNIIEDTKPGHAGYLGKCHLSWSVLQTLPKPLLERGTIYTGNSKALVFAAAYLPKNLSSTTKSSDTEGKGDVEKPNDYDEEQASLFFAVSWTTGPSVSELPQVQDKKLLIRQKLTEAGFHPDFHKLVDAVDDQALLTTPTRYSKSDTPVDWRQKLLVQHRTKPDRCIANPRVWLIGDSIHPMLPSRGMGANNAIHDTADALGPLLELARMKDLHNSLTDDEVSAQLAIYEEAMIPRAFSWVKKSSSQQV